MLRIGHYNRLEVKKQVPFGLYLYSEEAGEILLPSKYVPKLSKPGDILEVFVYLDAEERLIATTLRPLATVGEFAFLTIVHDNEYGAFADWGLEKDLFIPFREQQKQLIHGKKYLTYIYLDEHSGRIAGSHRYYRFLQNDLSELHEGMEVQILVMEETELGFRAIIDHRYAGILYRNEIFDPAIRIGYKGKAFIRRLREDGKIDLILQRPGYSQVTDFSDTLLKMLKREGGFIAINDKSSPELIYDFFGVSKKIFKKAVGHLYKERKIVIRDEGIEMT